MKPYPSIRVFKNPILERFSHVHPLTPLFVWAPVAGWFLWRTFAIHQLSPVYVGPLGAIAFLFWTLSEYLLHRFVFHFDNDTPLAQRLHFLIHGMHHADPVDPSRLVMPPGASIGMGIAAYYMFRLFLGPIWVDPFFAFFVIGYLSYDYTHFYVHHFNPTTRYGKYLKNSHMQHHYVSPRSRWGVSSPLWDYVFGTLEDVRDNERVV